MKPKFAKTTSRITVLIAGVVLAAGQIAIKRTKLKDSAFCLGLVFVIALMPTLSAQAQDEPIEGQLGDPLDAPFQPHDSHLGPGSIDIIPGSPTVVGNCIPTRVATLMKRMPCATCKSCWRMSSPGWGVNA